MKKIKPGKRGVLFIAIGLVSYLCFLVSGIPASFAYTKFIVPMDRGRVLNLQGLTGTIWAGGAAETRIAGLSLGKLQWDMHILKLFTGKLALDVILESKEGRIEGEVQAGTGGELTLQSVRGRLPVQTFMPLFYGMPFAVSGSVNADINHAEIIPGKKLVVDGKVIWHAAALTAPQAFEFGDLFMVLRPMPDGSNILLKDQGGPLDLDGNIQIKNSGEYKANLLLGTRGKQDDLELALKILGRTNPQGKVQVSRTGRLQNWR